MEKFIKGIKACIVQYDCYLVGGYCQGSYVDWGSGDRDLNRTHL